MNPTDWHHWLWIGAGLLSGSIPFGWIAARLRGIDIQTRGSGNIGATNVARTLGRGWGLLVLIADAAKGALPVLAASRLAATGEQAGAGALAMAVGLAAVTGHCFSPWLRFRGGKGVATALGVFVVIDPLASLGAVLLFALIYAAFRVASLGSLLAALAFPGLLYLRGHSALAISLAGVLALLIVVRHRDNIQRLRAGKENKV